MCFHEDAFIEADHRSLAPGRRIYYQGWGQIIDGRSGEVLQMDYVWVGFGGILGALSRYYIGNAFALWFGLVFPYGTMFINVTGSMLLGLIQVLAMERFLFSPRFRLFSGVGFCGAYTTFSTFTKETLNLLQTHHPGPALLYCAGSVICCLLGSWLGIVAGRLLFMHRTVPGRNLDASS
jgi:CrcB protein